MAATTKIASAQSLSIYKLLSTNKELTAKQIGDRLGIFPNAVYRSMMQLMELGVVKKSDTFPERFSITSIESAMGWYLLQVQRSFRESFPYGEQSTQLAKEPVMSVIETRQSLIAKTNKDVGRATREINFVVSGLEVPAETILAYSRAVSKGVKIRALLQKRDDTSPEQLKRWLNIGLSVRYTADLGIRMFLFDSKIVYVTSYHQNKKEEALGLRFEYGPICALMGDLFEQKWEAGFERF